jgi:hypothetical protein
VLLKVFFLDVAVRAGVCIVKQDSTHLGDVGVPGVCDDTISVFTSAQSPGLLENLSPPMTVAPVMATPVARAGARPLAPAQVPVRSLCCEPQRAVGSASKSAGSQGL